MSLLDTASPYFPFQRLGLRPGASDISAEEIETPAWTRRQTLLAIVSLLIFSGLALACWSWSGTVVPWDSKNHFYPMFRFLADTLREGRIPLWNPYHFAGHPSVADPQSLLFTPTMVLFALIAPDASMQLFDTIIFAHLCFGGLAVVGLCRRYRWHPAAAVLAAMIFMLGGAASSRLQHTGMILSYSFFPAALWALEATLAQRSYRAALLLGVMAALMSVGRDQVAFLFDLVLAFRLVFVAIESGNPFGLLRSRLGVLFVAGFVLLSLLIVPILLTLQFLGTSNRPGIPFGIAAAGSLDPANFVTMFVPNFFGSLDVGYDYWGPNYATASVADWTDRSVDYLFIGTLPCLLLIWHGLGAGRLFERRVAFYTLALVLALAYALGRYTPFFSFVFDWWPGVSLYRRPADATFIVNVALAFCSGYLLHHFIMRGLPRSLFAEHKILVLLLIGVSLCGLGVVLYQGLLFSAKEGHLASSLGQLGLAAAFALSGILLLTVFRSPHQRAMAACVLVALTGAEILWRNAASALNAEPIDRYAVYATMPSSNAAGISSLRHELSTKRAQGEQPRVEILGLSGPWQNASMMLKLEDTLGYNPLRINEYERAVGPGENASDINLRHYPGTFRGYTCRLASLLGLEYLVLDRPLEKLPRHVPRPRDATLIHGGDNMYIYKLGSAAPRAYFATRVKPVDGNDAIDDAVWPGFDRANEVLIDKNSMDDLDGEVLNRDAASLPAQAHVAITNYEENRVTLSVDTDKAGVLVLHDLFYAGWEVRVDGERQPLLHANILFRGVEVPEGHHEVEFVFRPFSFANLTAAATGILHRHAEN
ncbi:hypothetical protein Bind_1817 [Beijerinckia indica subsp. indica ATCC 9039]|uniref:YfhO family protein n=2 Tax=Beijerinckia TaxID=532 RepID=B2IDK9_BEII9|nr:hypothetical protein Bind_1817 [Beijerinckia indica subsp. indica ATCC 9039]